MANKVLNILCLPQEKNKTWKQAIFTLEFWVLLPVVVLTSGCLNGVLYGRASDDVILYSMHSSSLNFIRQLMLLPFYFYAIFYLARKICTTFYIIKNNLLLTFSFLLIFFSFYWSLEPWESLRRGLNLLCSTSFGLYLAVKYSPLKLIILLSYCLLMICFFTFAVVLLDPVIAIHHDEHFPALRAYFIQKNSLGMVMGLASIVALVLGSTGSSRKLALCLFLVAFPLAVCSLSRTTWINMAVMTSTFFSLLFWRKHKKIGTILFLLIFFILGSAVSLIGLNEIILSIGSTLDRNVSTLTGRTLIWEGVLDALSGDRFWFGYGYSSFWSSMKGALGRNWGVCGTPMHAHNGWLQTMTDIGFVGAVLMCFVMLISFVKTFQFASTNSDPRCAFGFIFIVFMMIQSISETVFFIPDNLFWILFVYFAYYNADVFKTKS